MYVHKTLAVFSLFKVAQLYPHLGIPSGSLQWLGYLNAYAAILEREKGFCNAKLNLYRL